ncbi:hypothetical protein CBM2615_B140211 [Cupriavidus taiwanensis]|uniref:Uncharacterized protein n=1 Tax=Cupriavidus taiwanensis TaxID=164546 RepID=A0A375E6I3_9BURK|nr:hypothetical protein CBM2614_B150153 [Cupriavidus taiwanensis]SOZ64388.1 hypothetical protein CBM2615_B140211 [Cupriavidus taiwanensis]SOZ68125.1 hypothetical protein CBM2613_B110211 [Cupriavidus taiwanensis]SPA07937.1 hypothetical protein CBM2625_B110212 [Cupriavidus taiwanensis]
MTGPAKKVRMRTSAEGMRVVVQHEPLLYIARHILRYISYDLKSSPHLAMAAAAPAMPSVRWRTKPGCLSPRRFPTFI